VTIHAFGVLVAIAVLLGTWIVRRRATREGLDAEHAQRFVTWILVGGFVGAHLVDRLIYNPAETLADPLSLLAFWQGLSSFGGFLGAIVGAWVFLRRHPLADRWRYLDCVAYAFPFGWISGRTGCFVAFDHRGRETTFFLAQEYADGIVRHNLGLDEALYTILVALLFWGLGRKGRPAGFYVSLLPLVYTPFRFALDFLRDVDVRYLGLTPAQYGAVVLFGMGLWLHGKARAGRLRAAE
jgi:phosphatidylglycerol:prolipoprotein diacylglycerol transferase